MAKTDDSSTINKKKRADDEPEPSTSKIQLQRRRVWRACESCRRKKIKCDGCEPTCSQCATSGSQCTWLQTKDRAALSRHYVQELEARLLQMESVFKQLAPVLDQLGPLPNGSTVQGITSGTSTGPSNVLKSVSNASSPDNSQHSESFHHRSRSSESNPIKIEEEEFNDSFGQLALDEHGHKRWIGGSSTMSLIQSFRSLTSATPLHRVSPLEDDPRSPNSANKLYFPATVFFGKVRALPGPEEVEYPPRDLADKLVEAYFARYHFLMPVIDKPSFLKQYTHLMDNTNDINIARNETPFVALVFALFACAAQFVDDPRLRTSENLDDGGMGMLYYERSLILSHISHARIQVAHVQCYVLMASYLCSVNCLPQAWLVTGQAVRTGQDLGLHRSPRRNTMSPIEKETLRKIWWCVYTLDRMLALALGRPLGINDADCDVELPVEEDDHNLSDYFNGAKSSNKVALMTGFVSLIKLYEIAGRVLREVYALENCKDHLEPDQKLELQRTVEVLDDQLTKWCDELLPIFKSQPETDEQVSIGSVLASHYYCVLNTLHRNFLPVKQDQPVTPKSTIKAISSARSCIRLAPSMRHVVPPSHHLAFFIQNLFSSAVTLLLYAMHANEPQGSTAALEEAKSTLPALESWEGQWPGAKKCKELLLELVQTASEAMSHTANNPPAPSVLTPPAAVRRRSVTISTPSHSSPPHRRPVKPKNVAGTRRNHSREPGATRRSAVIAPYSIDDRRARSASRRRPADISEGNNFDLHPGSSMKPFPHAFPSPGSAPSASPADSPASNTLPSPTLTPNDPAPDSRQVIPSGTGYNYSSMLPLPTSDFGFAMDNSATAGHHNLTAWGNGNGNEHNELFPTSPTDTTMQFNGNNGFGFYPQSLDTSYLGGNNGFDHFGDLSGVGQLPPTTSFDTPGLPFRGLDMLRNYNPSGYPTNMEQESLWQTVDPGAFRYDPEVPFTFGGYSDNVMNPPDGSR